jgi:HK97 family phage major capsid protein
METTNGALKFPGLQNDPPTLLSRPWYEFSTMDSAINTGATENNYLLVYGDIRQAYVIADRVGTTVEILPAYGSNGRPTAQRHMFMTKRTGAAVVNAAAALVLNVATTA